MNAGRITAAIGGFLIGGGVGTLVGMVVIEKKVRAEYNESLESVTRAMALRPHTINVYGPVETEAELDDLSNQEKDTVLEGLDFDGETRIHAGQPVNIFERAAAKKIEIGPEGEASGNELTRTEGDEDDAPEYINHYAKAVLMTDPVKETSIDMFVDGGINDYGISYIEEDEFDDENGNFKGHVALVLEENNATFFMEGVEIKDWDERLGDSIIVDFYRLVPPNAPPILYVRNHKRDEDYEVTRELP